MISYVYFTFRLKLNCVYFGYTWGGVPSAPTRHQGNSGLNHCGPLQQDQCWHSEGGCASVLSSHLCLIFLLNNSYICTLCYSAVSMCRPCVQTFPNFSLQSFLHSPACLLTSLSPFAFLFPFFLYPTPPFFFYLTIVNENLASEGMWCFLASN